jgi:hypothetical protein
MDRTMIAPALLREKFALGLSYPAYTAQGTPEQQSKWQRVYESLTLSQAQTSLVASFTRRVNILVSSGLWCGDCAHQCPMLARIAEAHPASQDRPDTPGIDLRFLNRDEHMDLADQVRICGGNRVPTVIFMAEDFEFISLLGDKTLTRLRAKAAKALGPSCPLPGASLPPDEAAATLQEWLNEVERVHLTLRLSTRLRELHHD